MKTQVPQLEKEPEHGRPEQENAKFPRLFHDQAVAPAPVKEPIEKEDQAVPGKWIGMGVEGKDVMGRAPEGENDRRKTDDHHRFAEEKTRGG